MIYIIGCMVVASMYLIYGVGLLLKEDYQKRKIREQEKISNKHEKTYRFIAEVMYFEVDKFPEIMPITSTDKPKVTTRYIVTLHLKLDKETIKAKDIEITKELFDEMKKTQNEVWRQSNSSSEKYYIATKAICRVEKETNKIKDILSVEILSTENVLNLTID